VSVHTSCYGLASTTKNEQWECHACRSIQPNENGIKPLNKRPNQCKLCSVKNGIHAMHPIYDKHGKNGKQIGWGHTLCALGIGANAVTRGCVYGCDENGYYEGDDVLEDQPEQEFDDDSSISSNEDLSKSPKQSPEKQETNHEPEEAETHHFVVCTTNENSPWASVVRDSRELKCMVCGLKDNKAGILRIPVQCEAGGQEELAELKNKRRRTRRETCYLAMHVGCAKWKNDKPFQRVYFFPGMTKIENGLKIDIEPKCCLYCNKHAKDIYDHPKSAVAKPTSANTATATQSEKKKTSQVIIEKPTKSTSITTTSSSKRKPVTNIESTSDTKRTKRNSPPQSRSTSPTKDQLFPQVLEYVLSKLKSSIKGKELEATRQAKEYWKHKSKLSSSEFKELWNKIKETVSKRVKLEKERANSITSIDSALQRELKRASITSIDSNVKKELNRSTSIESVSSMLDEIVINGNNNEKNEPNNENPWASLWMPNYQRNSEAFRLLMEC